MADAIIDGRGSGNKWGIDNHNSGFVTLKDSTGSAIGSNNPSFVNIPLPSGGFNANLTVAVSGTPTQLGDNPVTQGVVLKALDANAGVVYHGFSGTNISGTGEQLYAGDTATYMVNNSNLIWVDVSVNGEGLSYRGS